MKDLVTEFENLNDRIESLFEGLGWLNPSGWFKNKQQSDQPNKEYTRGPALTKYLSKIETGDCDSGISNKRFISNPGSSEAYFHNALGGISTVKNIKPFLEKAGITKQTLRCYDLNKDPLKIDWLFDGVFDAEFLSWDKDKKKIIFKGRWTPTSTQFNGVLAKTPEELASSNKIENKYFVVIGDKEYGPFSSGDIVKSIKSNKPLKGYKRFKATLETIIRPTNSTHTQLVKDNKSLVLKLQQTSSNIVKKAQKTTKKPVIVPTPRRLPKNP